MKSFTAILEGRSRLAIGIVAIILTLVMGAVDFLLGPELSTSILYVVPVVVAAWYGGRAAGHLTGILSAIVWLATDVGSGMEYAFPAIVVWNAVVMLTVFVVITQLVTRHRQVFQKEERAADTDPLTGLLNLRGLTEVLEKEILRARRFKRPFCLAYIDLDNFKMVNDRSGHAEGDKLLMTVAGILREESRKVDSVARVGGDEFVVLLVETDAAGAEAVYGRTHPRLLKEMETHSWPVTFSVGIVCFSASPEDVRHAIEVADELMYEVKKNHKNDVICKTWPPASSGTVK